MLLYLFRGPWHIYALEDTYTQISELENMPSSETLTSVLRKRLDARKPQTGDEPVQTGVDAEAFRVLAACGLAFTIVYAALAYLR